VDVLRAAAPHCGYLPARSILPKDLHYRTPCGQVIKLNIPLDVEKQGSKKLKSKWEFEVPSAVRRLEKSVEACLVFFNFPEEEWIALRTTNIIERLNKEFKRRTKPLEIVAGERFCFALLAFIAPKMELHWRANPLERS
jgi:transposase-like protein